MTGDPEEPLKYHSDSVICTRSQAAVATAVAAVLLRPCFRPHPPTPPPGTLM